MPSGMGEGGTNTLIGGFPQELHSLHSVRLYPAEIWLVAFILTTRSISAEIHAFLLEEVIVDFLSEKPEHHGWL